MPIDYQISVLINLYLALIAVPALLIYNSLDISKTQELC